MSDGPGRYRRVFPRLWRHPGFRSLSQAEQRVALYLLCGPQTNRIGLFHLSIATGAEDLELGLDTFKKALGKLSATFGWMFDAEARVFYIPSWWKFNQPDHEKVLRGNLKDLNEVPPCGLSHAFSINLGELKPELHECFVEAIRKAHHKATRSQEQEQESRIRRQEQEQEPCASRGTDGNGHCSDHHLVIAREVLRTTNPDADIAHLVDTFAWVHQTTKHKTQRFTRDEAIAALNHRVIRTTPEPRDERRRPDDHCNSFTANAIIRVRLETCKSTRRLCDICRRLHGSVRRARCSCLDEEGTRQGVILPRAMPHGAAPCLAWHAFSRRLATPARCRRHVARVPTAITRCLPAPRGGIAKFRRRSAPKPTQRQARAFAANRFQNRCLNMAGRPRRSGGHNRLSVEQHNLFVSTFSPTRHGAATALKVATRPTLPSPDHDAVAEGLSGRGLAFVQQCLGTYTGWTAPSLTLLREAGHLLNQVERLRGTPEERRAQRMLLGVLAALHLEA